MLALVLSILGAPSAHALIYYVSGGGHGDTPNDSNTCTQARTITTPKLTVGAGIGCLSAGDTLFLRGGTYSDGVNTGVTFLASGTSEQTRVILASTPNEIATLTLGVNIQSNPDSSVVHHVTISRLHVSYARMVAPAHHIRIEDSDIDQGLVTVPGIPCNFEAGNVVQAGGDFNEVLRNYIHGSRVTYYDGCSGVTVANYGIYAGSLHNSLIDGNLVSQNVGYGLHLYGSQHTDISDNVIRNNTFTNNSSDDGTRGLILGAVIVSSGSNNLFYNNLVYNNGLNGQSGGVEVGSVGGGGVSGNNLLNNTITNNGGYAIQVYSNTSGGLIQGNIVYGNAQDSIAEYAPGANVVNHNLVGINPNFVNSGAGDLRVLPDSTAIDTGVCVAQVPVDIAGTTRPQGATCDIGAYEFISGGSGAVVLSCDSQELSTGPYPCSNAIDTSATTFWHTEYVASSPPHPHEIQVDTGVDNQPTYGFLYQARQDGYLTGIVTSYQFYVSNTTANWGAAVATGALPYTAGPKTVGFPVKQGRYFRFVALAEGAALPYTSVAGISVLTSSPTAAKVLVSVQPSNGVSNTALPSWTVGAYDSADVLVGSYSGTVQITLGANPGLAGLLGTTNSAFVSGSHAWCCDLMLTKIGVGYTFTATSPGLTSATTTPFTITGTAPGLPTLVHAVPTP